MKLANVLRFSAKVTNLFSYFLYDCAEVLDPQQRMTFQEILSKLQGTQVPEKKDQN